MNRIQDYFKLKYEKISKPDMYLEATLSKMLLEDGKMGCTMSAKQNLKTSVTNVEESLSRSGRTIPSEFVTTFSSNYSPWLEDSS